MPEAVPVTVMRGVHGDRVPTFGPLPGVRLGNAVAYEFELPERFEPWPDRTRLERTFVLLDVGVSFSEPCWQHQRCPDGSTTTIPPEARGCWYVDLLDVSEQDGHLVLRDLYVDVMVPTDGRPYRQLDLDELADALDAGAVTAEEAVHALRRWQRFLDRHLHASRWPSAAGWTDFPPSEIAALQALPAPLGPVVRADG